MWFIAIITAVIFEVDLKDLSHLLEQIKGFIYSCGTHGRVLGSDLLIKLISTRMIFTGSNHAYQCHALRCHAEIAFSQFGNKIFESGSRVSHLKLGRRVFYRESLSTNIPEVEAFVKIKYLLAKEKILRSRRGDCYALFSSILFSNGIYKVPNLTTGLKYGTASPNSIDQVGCVTSPISSPFKDIDPPTTWNNLSVSP